MHEGPDEKNPGVKQKEGNEMKKEPVFRYAQREDIPLILQFIKELADYEKMLDEVKLGMREYKKRSKK